MTTKRTYDRFRADLQGLTTFTAIHPEMPLDELKTLKFLCLQVDGEDYNLAPEDNDEEYNLILLHPVTKCLHWAYSIDFDFIEESPKQKYLVRFIQSEIREFEMSSSSMGEVMENWLEASGEFGITKCHKHLDEKLVSVHQLDD